MTAQAGGAVVVERADDGVADDVEVVDVGQVVDDVALRLYVTLGRLVRLLRRDGTAELGPGSLSALVTITKYGPMRLGDLAARESVSPPTLTRIMAVLQDAGLVERQVDPHDRRAALVAVTASGRGLVRGVRSSRMQALAQRLAVLPEADRSALLAALPALERLACDDG